MERRLAAILAADVVGYSRLIEADEAETLAALKFHREALIDPKIAQYHGRIVKLMGDGLLAEFPSAVEAVQCAVEIQHTMAERNADATEERRITFRIGINIGDIVVENEDIFGDGVNVAARLEGLAKPGGICISGNVFEQLGGKTDISFEDIGERSVKNIKKPVAVWRWVPDAAGQMAPQLALPEKPSIAVLPFLNMSGDPEQEIFADGMAEDIISGLSRYRWFFVIARGSSFSYKGRTADAKQVSQELGVRYLVEGSLRKSKGKVRVTAQLIDALNGRHIWSERYDRDLNDIFAVQDEITESIVATIEPELGAVERERARRNPPDNLDAWGLYQRGLWHFYGDWTCDGVAEAKRLLQRACDLDPSFAAAYAELVFVHVAEVIRGFTDDPEATLEEAAVAAERAVSLDPRDPAAHCALGRVLIYRHSFDRAISEMEAALDLSASSDRAYYCLGLALLYGGRPEESIPQFEKAVRLNPRSPMLWAYLNNLGRAYFRQEKYEEALGYFEDAIQKPNVTFMPFAHLAATLSHLGRTEDARSMLAEVKKREPNFSPGTIENTVGVYGEHSGTDQIIDGLRKAGLDENVSLGETDRLSLPDKPSIAVLPFTNMSTDPDQEYFADGITEDIITELSRFRELFVIARNSSFFYKGKSARVEDIAHELGVRYIVEGSVRKSGDRVRVTAQLIDAASGSHIWAERYDRELEDIFAVQDEVTQAIVSTVAGRLKSAGPSVSKRKHPQNMTAYELVLRAKEHFQRQTKVENARARELFQQAIDLEPDYGLAHVWLGWTHFFDYELGWGDDPDESSKLGQSCVRHAMALDNTDAWAQAGLAYSYTYSRKFDLAQTHIENATRLNPNDADILALKGLFFCFFGKHEEGVSSLEMARRRNPFAPDWYLWCLGIALYTCHCHEEAVSAWNEMPNPPTEIFACLAAGYAQLDLISEAERCLADYLQRSQKELTNYPGEDRRRWRSFWYKSFPYKENNDMEHLLDGLRKAGLPI